MTKLQTLETEFQTLPAEEQREFISRYVHLVSPADDAIFELTDTELAELDRRLMKVDGEPTYSIEQVFARLKI
jgi:hypothetical protein